jgi:hypothetical protein
MGRTWDKRSCVPTPAVLEDIEEIYEIPQSAAIKIIRQNIQQVRIFTDTI